MIQKDFIRRAIEQRELVEFLLNWYDDATPYLTHAAPTGPYLGSTVDESGRTFEDVLWSQTLTSEPREDLRCKKNT